MLDFLGTLVVGFIVGLIARAIKPGDDKLGLIMTTLLGIAGAFLARYAGMAMGWYQQSEPAGWIASVIGAVVLLFMTQEAFNKFGQSKGWTAGVDASVAIVKVGVNGEIDTTTANNPVQALVLTNAGLMANLALEGTKITRLDL